MNGVNLVGARATGRLAPARTVIDDDRMSEGLFQPMHLLLIAGITLLVF